MLNYLRRNISLLVGVLLIASLLLFALVGRLVWDVDLASPLAAPANQPPTAEHPLGTDRQGRDLLAVMIEATPSTLYIGLLAGFIGVAIGTALALFGAYYGGGVDTAIRGVVDVGLTLPPLLILILVAISVQGGLNVSQMALVVASLSWLWPARTIRSQVLTIKERAYIQVARLSGAGPLRIIFTEILPNLLPYLAATFVGSVAAAILAAIGLEVIGLGPIEANTLGVTLYWVGYYSALLHGMWWWFMPPVVIIIILFIGLFSISSGLDELANPRRRRVV
ncbi:MAG: ABC transporter permease [Chloroflexota bacterium]|nr:ABC transporter permease [Chloroflexota bacterium]